MNQYRFALRVKIHQQNDLNFTFVSGAEAKREPWRGLPPRIIDKNQAQPVEFQIAFLYASHHGELDPADHALSEAFVYIGRFQKVMISTVDKIGVAVH